MEEIELNFPYYFILKASAGSGKTRALTRRYVSFLLLAKDIKGSLKKILAITFSNNAAYEMKMRIIGWLKDIYFKDSKVFEEFGKIAASEDEEISLKSSKVLDSIIDNYSDFQVKTIDSFMTSIFKSSCLDFNFNQDFEILLNNDFLMSFAYDLFLKDIDEDTYKAEIFRETIDKIAQDKNSFLWNPAKEIFEKINDLHVVSSSTYKKIKNENLEMHRKELEEEISKLMGQLIDLVQSSKLERNNRNRIFDEFPTILKNKNFKEFLNRGIDTCPVKKPKDKNLQTLYEKICDLWNIFVDTVSQYAYLYARTFYLPYLRVFMDFEDTLHKIKRKEGKIFIEDINKILSLYLIKLGVPDVYFRLGERIHHFLIDEFQDTSPIQWINLYPLIENALSENGSLFVVGDTKQAIYGFRGADYRIMKTLESENIFPSAEMIIDKLNINYRSKGKILDFVDKFFKEKILNNEEYKKAASLTGLNSDDQKSLEEVKDSGYVEVKAFYVSDDENLGRIGEYLSATICDLRNRGYGFKDIALLCFKNEEVVQVSAILNKLEIPFISYSSLDVRKRKVTIEILNLLKFLDSPVDDFAFSVFILGDIFKKIRGHEERIDEEKISREIESFVLKNRDSKTLYKAFQKSFPELWNRYFDKLFRFTGYLPVYDLLCSIYTEFRVFEIMTDEEATFLKILELVKFFEERGLSSIKDLIEFFSSNDEDEKLWNITLGSDIDAVQIMTIHKAKGLGFPVVILFLSNLKNNREDYILHESDEEIYIMKINKYLADKCKKLDSIRTKARIQKLADTLNTLYVAFTRAEDEMYIVCNIKKEDDFPFDILKEFFDYQDGCKLKKSFSPDKGTLKFIEPEYNPINLDFYVSQDSIHLEEKKRGELIHEILAKFEYLSFEDIKELEKRLENMPLQLKMKRYLSEIKKIFSKMLQKDEIRTFFENRPGRKCFNEFEVVDEHGRIHRIDRLVVDANQITVIEYKTGQASDEHKEQVSLYMGLISEIYKGYLVKGFIYYLDLAEVIWIQ